MFFCTVVESITICNAHSNFFLKHVKRIRTLSTELMGISTIEADIPLIKLPDSSEIFLQT